GSYRVQGVGTIGVAPPGLPRIVVLLGPMSSYAASCLRRCDRNAPSFQTLQAAAAPKTGPSIVARSPIAASARLAGAFASQHFLGGPFQMLQDAHRRRAIFGCNRSKGMLPNIGRYAIESSCQ